MISTLEMMNIIKKHQATCPIQLIPIAEELGLNVYTVSEWQDNLSGKLQREENSKSKFSIYVNNNHPAVRQRFTIAHEIAHFVLHRDLIKNSELIDDALYRSGLSNALEAEANKFAADLLMPWHLINEKINSGIDSVSELAKIFNVSNSSMSIRLGIPFETT